MRTVFIVNPKAGKGRGREKFIKEIEAASKKTGVAVEVYSTRAVGDGEALAAQLACRENLIARPCLGHEAQAGVNHAAKMQDSQGQKPTRKRKRHGKHKPCGARARGRLRE